MEVLELQTPCTVDYNPGLARGLPSCLRLHTLVANGLVHLDLRLLRQLPRLQYLALNHCHAEGLAAPTELTGLQVSAGRACGGAVQA